MLNIEKVKNMTKAAAYESGPEKKNIEISDYFRTDYIGLHMVKSGIAYAVTFVIIAAIWFMGKTEDIMLMLTKADYLESLIKTIVVLFAAGLVAYEILVYIYYSYKYAKAKKSVKGYHSHLKQIHKFYEEQEKTEEVAEITL
jgi:hypothetical protein